MYRQSHVKIQVRSDLWGWEDGWGTARWGQEVGDCEGDAQVRWIRRRQTLNGDREIERNNVSPGTPASSIQSPWLQSELCLSPTVLLGPRPWSQSTRDSHYTVPSDRCRLGK